MDDKVKRVSSNIEEVTIDDILIGDRARVDMKDLTSLALSMSIEGQLQPIIIDLGKDGKFNLVDGERRIRAAEMNGWKKIEAIKLGSLTDVRRKELEIIQCIQREQLDFIEEARAVKKLVDMRKKEAEKGSLGRPSRSIKNKEVAVELNITETRMSEDIKIAEAIEDHPELEAQGMKRTEFLRRIRKRDFYVPKGGVLQSIYEENFILADQYELLNSIGGKIIDLAILHPDEVNLDLLEAVCAKLKSNGQILMFVDHRYIRDWEDQLKAHGFNLGLQPYIWHIKGKDSAYQNYLWAGKTRPSPLRVIPQVIDAARPFKALHIKAKPFSLINQIIKCCTDRGDFVVIPECFDIDTVRCCVEIGRNVRAGQSNRILRDRLIMSITA